MRTMLLAGAGLLTALAAPVAINAQTADPGASAQGEATALPPEQQAVVDAWPADRQADYRSWPVEQQSYFWTLTPEQQNGFWALTPDQRGMIAAMTPDQQARAWESVMAQLAGEAPPAPMPPGAANNPPGAGPAAPGALPGEPTNGIPDPGTAGQPVPPAMPADPSYGGEPYKGALTSPPPEAANKEYPVCSRTVTDNCRNPGGR